MQKVNINESAYCEICGSCITEIGKFTYLKDVANEPRDKDEECMCNNCCARFILHYDYFDEDGHINNFVFCNDINDPNYNWQDQLTSEQKKEIAEHLKTCKKCTDRLDNEMLADAWITSIVHTKHANNPPSE